MPVGNGSPHHAVLQGGSGGAVTVARERDPPGCAVAHGVCAVAHGVCADAQERDPPGCAVAHGVCAVARERDPPSEGGGEGGMRVCRSMIRP